MGSPHDALFRHTFSQPEHAVPLLRHLLPAPIAAKADWATLRVLSGTQVDPRLRRQQSDLLFSLQIGGKPCLIYVLVEHKARNDPWTALQVASYVLGIWKGLLRQRPQPHRLPPIIPLVVHHGRHGFTAATELSQLIDLDGVDPSTVAAMQPWLPQFRFMLTSMHDVGEDELRNQSLSLLGKLTLGVMQFVGRRRPEDVAAAIIRWADVAFEVLRAPSGHEAFEAISSYVAQTTSLDPERIEILVERHVSREASQIMKTTAARLRDEGRAEGRTQGRVELLEQLLVARFGPLPPEIASRIQSAARKDLDRWAIAVLKAASLEDVFNAD